MAAKTGPTYPFPIRISHELKAKFEAVARAKRRKPTELARLLIEDEVAAWERENGPVKLPEKP